MKIAEGDKTKCTSCENGVEVVSRSGKLVFDEHTYGRGIGASLRCSRSGQNVEDGEERGVLRPLLAGPIAGVDASDIFGALEDLDPEIYNDYGTDRIMLQGKDEVVDNILRLIARAVENAKRG